MMVAELTETDRRILDHLQREIPLTLRPYRDIAARLDMTEETLLQRVRALSGPPPAPIRQISAIFDSKSLGYQSCLVAARIPPARLAEAVSVINGHPGVSHNYLREHAYNVWFTLAIPPDSRLGLERTVALLQQLTGATQMRLMPALKLYKIGVKFDLGVDTDTAASNGDGDSGGRTSQPGAVSPAPLDENDKQIIRVAQQPLPATSRPFDAWAAQAGVAIDELLAAMSRLRGAGVMRRFSAVLRHREIGVSANAMGVWAVPLAQVDDFGHLAAQYPAVSHCYLRPSYPDWPYSIFTMVHGRSRVDCEATLASISRASGMKEYTSLYSIEEFKKVRVKYFVGDIEQWETVHALGAALSLEHGR